MRRILGTTWGASILSALFGAALVALIGSVVGAPPAVTILSAVFFGALLTLIVQLSVVIAILWQARGTKNDVGTTMMQEIESSVGQAELKKMNFISLLTVAVVQEMYLAIFVRTEPLWIWRFFGAGEDSMTTRDFGKWNQYLEWGLIIGLAIFTLGGASLMAVFANSIGSLVCAVPGFLLGIAFMFLVGLYFASVLRRLFILYATRADESQIA